MFNRMKPHLAPALLLLAMTFGVYASSLGHNFLTDWDDTIYITNNEAVRGFTLGHLKTAFSTFYAGNYAPLHIISYMLDYTIWGMRAAGFIFTNILIHALNGLLYYALVIKLTTRRLWAFGAGFIFLLHPVQVESVVWISQRKNVLAMFFFLISFLLYTAYREPGFKTQNSKLETRNSKLFYAGSVAAFLLALLAKSVVVILPPILLLYDLCYLEKEKRGKWLADKIPYIAVAGLIALVALKSQVLEFGGGRTGYHGGSPLATFYTMLPVLMRYLGMLIWPAQLSAFYNPAIRTDADWAVALSGAGVVILCLGGYYLYRWRKDLFFWAGVFFIGLVPVLQIVPLVTLINDRYFYFPMIGSAAFMAGIAGMAMTALGEPYRKGLAVILCVVLLALPVLSIKRAEVWQDSLTLWQDAYSKVPDNSLVCLYLGHAYQETGRRDAALPLYLRALSLDPLNRDALHNISMLYLEIGDTQRGWPYVLELVKNNPQCAECLFTLGNYHYQSGELEKAEAVYRRVLALKPRSGAALRNLGLVYAAQGKFEPARQSFQEAMVIDGENAEIHFDLACLEATVGNAGAALAHLEAAFKLGFKDADAVEKNPTLDSLRAMPEFRQLVGRYLRN